MDAVLDCWFTLIRSQDQTTRTAYSIGDDCEFLFDFVCLPFMSGQAATECGTETVHSIEPNAKGTSRTKAERVTGTRVGSVYLQSGIESQEESERRAQWKSL